MNSEEVDYEDFFEDEKRNYEMRDCDVCGWRESVRMPQDCNVVARCIECRDVLMSVEIEENEIKKICDKLKEQYMILNIPIKIIYKKNSLEYSQTLEYPQTVIKNGNDIGGMKIQTRDKKNIVDFNNLTKEEEIYLASVRMKKERQGDGTNILGLLFSKIQKIRYEYGGKSECFWIKTDPYYDPDQLEQELTRENFFKYNNERIKKYLAKSDI